MIESGFKSGLLTLKVKPVKRCGFTQYLKNVISFTLLCRLFSNTVY